MEPVQRATDVISTLPAELIHAIVCEVIAVDPFELHFSNRSQAIDLLHVTHVNSRLRRIVINDPPVWAQVAFLNGINAQFLQAILLRSLPYTISLAFTEDRSLPEYQVLTLAISQMSRVACLQAKVAEGHDGTFVKSLLAAPAPNLRYCVVSFHESRPVCLNPHASHLFGGNTPHLETLDLLNCYILPTPHHFPHLSSISIRYLGWEAAPPPLMHLRDIIEWKGQLWGITALMLSNCVTPVDPAEELGLPEVRLPLLRVLAIAAGATVCRQLARLLRFPPQCNTSVSLLFPHGRLSREDIAVAASGACTFLPPQEFLIQCHLTMLKDRHSIRLVNVHGGFFVFVFEFHLLQPVVPKPIRLCLWALNLTLRPLNMGSFSVEGLMAYYLWDSLSSILREKLRGVSELNLALHWQEFPASVALGRLFSAMPAIETAVLDTPEVWGHGDFLGIAFKADFLPGLKTIGLKIEIDDFIGANARLGLTNFLQHRSHLGGSIVKVQFRISSAVVQRVGFAGLEYIRMMVGEVGFDFPDDVALDWEEGETIELISCL